MQAKLPSSQVTVRELYASRSLFANDAVIKPQILVPLLVLQEQTDRLLISAASGSLIQRSMEIAQCNPAQRGLFYLTDHVRTTDHVFEEIKERV